MILTGVDGRKYTVHIQYEKLGDTNRRGLFRQNDKPVEVTHRTTVRIHPIGCSEETPCRIPTEWVGHAYCSAEDQFQKRKGRKYALARAFHKMLPNPEDKGPRALLWASFHGKTSTLRSRFDAVLHAVRARKHMWSDDQKQRLLEALLNGEHQA
jgi:hypothetical protein